MNYGGEQWQEAHMTQPSLEQQRSERREGGGGAGVTNCIHLSRCYLLTRNQKHTKIQFSESTKLHKMDCGRALPTAGHRPAKVTGCPNG